jgi:monoamine oxidase
MPTVLSSSPRLDQPVPAQVGVDEAETTDYDTLIIGAGVAGLAAGRMLAAAGRRVAILEARERLGGRIFTRHLNAAGRTSILPVELGAEFIHGLPEETWALVREAGLATFELKGSRFTMMNGRLEKEDERLDAAFEVLRKLMTWAPDRPGPADMTFAEYLRVAKVDTPQEGAAAAYVEGFNAADRDVIGIAALAKQQSAEDAIQGDRVFRVRAGYDAIPHVLAAGIAKAGCPIFLKRNVERITWRPGAMTASGTDERNRKFTLQGHRAIVTLPLGVLQAGVVDFEPRPGEVVSQARRLRMGAALRVTLVFRSRFWREGALKELQQLSFLFTPNRVPTTWWTAMPNRAPMLTGWIGGPAATEFQAKIRASADPDILPLECLRVLSSAFGISDTAIRRLLISWHSHDWDADEFARGAYSYVPAGALDAPDKLTEPVAGTLYFAGEHTDTVGDWGTVHGALRSGLRAARQVLATAP